MCTKSATFAQIFKLQILRKLCKKCAQKFCVRTNNVVVLNYYNVAGVAVNLTSNSLQACLRVQHTANLLLSVASVQVADNFCTDATLRSRFASVQVADNFC